MSLRVFAKTLYKALQLAAQRLRARPNLVRILKPARVHVVRVGHQAARLPLSRNTIVRTIQLAIRNSRLFARPFATLHHNRNLLIRNQPIQIGIHPLLRSIQRNRGVIEGIRNVFGSNIRYNKALQTATFPNQLDSYEIGQHIACGCNAAVYELRTRSSIEQQQCNVEFQTCTERPERLKLYPLALKIMFNYQFDLPEKHLWQEMGPELIPMKQIPKEALQGRMANFKILNKAHPNVIKLHTAFIDCMPILPDSKKLYPEALPSAGHYEAVISEPKTLFIVMKRYNMTLRDYVISFKRNYWTGRVLLGQLLEACVYLYENKISHRDMKSDNILLEFDNEDEIPHLVLSDFGSALANDSWEIDYSFEGQDLGGNLSLRAPEIRRLKFGPKVVANFQLADTWAAGTIGYEIFTSAKIKFLLLTNHFQLLSRVTTSTIYCIANVFGTKIHFMLIAPFPACLYDSFPLNNPFYSLLNSENYEDSNIPLLPRRLHYAVKHLVYKMVKVNPTERPLPHICANVISISLFRFGQDVKSFLSECGISMGWNAKQLKNSFSNSLKKLGEELDKKLEVVTELYAAETILSKLINPAVISNAEMQLRATFLSRINRDEIWQALEFFYDEEMYQRQNSNGSVSTDSSTPIPLSI